MVKSMKNIAINVLTVLLFTFIFYSISFAGSQEDQKMMNLLNSKQNLSQSELSMIYNHAMNNIQTGQGIENNCMQGSTWTCGDEEMYGAEGFIQGGIRLLNALCQRGYRPACK